MLPGTFLSDFSTEQSNVLSKGVVVFFGMLLAMSWMLPPLVRSRFEWGVDGKKLARALRLIELLRRMLFAPL